MLNGFILKLILLSTNDTGAPDEVPSFSTTSAIEVVSNCICIAAYVAICWLNRRCR